MTALWRCLSRTRITQLSVRSSTHAICLATIMATSVTLASPPSPSNSSSSSSSSSSSASSTLPKTRAVLSTKGWLNPDSFNFQRKSLLDVFQWQWSKKRDAAHDPMRGVVVERDLPTAIPRFVTAPSSVRADDGLLYTWLGHASALVQMHGLNVLVDPVLSERASPVSFAGPKRLRPLPFRVADLPPIDVVLISHSHFDHLSSETCAQLLQHSRERLQGKPETMHWVTSDGIKQWLIDTLKVTPSMIHSLEWWGQCELQVPSPSSSVAAAAPSMQTARITSTPACHWSERTPFDKYKTLWMGFAVEFGGKKFYYSGDTSYCHAFKEIGQHCGPFDLSILPIGAYEPRDFMKTSHCCPEEAVAIHCDVRSKQTFALHWGTFILSDEHVMAPKLQLEAEVKRLALDQKSFVTTKIGETLSVAPPL